MGERKERRGCRCALPAELYPHVEESEYLVFVGVLLHACIALAAELYPQIKGCAEYFLFNFSEGCVTASTRLARLCLPPRAGAISPAAAHQRGFACCRRVPGGCAYCRRALACFCRGPRVKVAMRRPICHNRTKCVDDTQILGF